MQRRMRSMRRCISRRSAVLQPRSPSVTVDYCTDRYSGRLMSVEIEIPDTFPLPGAVSGKRVVLTGAGRGLGALLAHAFSRAGARVALVARTERDLKAVA